jgi:hypothetical protein
MMLTMLLALTGCIDDEVFISGPITDTRGGGSPIADASVSLRGTEGDLFSSAVTDSDGWFEAPVPPQQIFFLHAEADGFVATSFAGLSSAEPIAVTEGELWLRQSTDLESIRSEFDGCAPESLGLGGVIEGEVRLYVAPDQDLDTLPLVTTATVTAYTADGSVSVGCYLDDEGVSAPGSAVTGETGRFALFNVPSGSISVLVSYTYGGTEPHEDWYIVYVPEGGVVPLYPALSTIPD